MKYNFFILIMFLFCTCRQVKNTEMYPLQNSNSNPQPLYSNKISNKYMPVMGVWGWREKELKPEGYKEAIDQMSKNSPFNLINLFLRFPDKEIVDKKVHAQVKLATEYALKHNIALVADIDVRQARRTFKNLYPQDLQEMIRIKEVPLSEDDSTSIVIHSVDLSDHYTGGDIENHIPLSSKLLKIFTYNKQEDGIVAETIIDITDFKKVVHSCKDSIVISLPKSTKSFASVMVSFTHLYPDVFSSSLIEFQRKIIQQYSDIPLAGVCKDEWGFPPYQKYIFNPYPGNYYNGIDDFWYSKSMGEAYLEKTNGRDILFDFILMTKKVLGMDSEKFMAINNYTEMCFKRHSELEQDYYQTVKEVFGPNAAVTVHPTWWPYPESYEFIKNGLNWWSATRDWAQTDETTPFGVRTALSKKWNSPVWYNMYYHPGDMHEQLWTSVLAGGRICYLSYSQLFDSELMRAESRIRLLNYIAESPLDCSIAVVFGHTSAMNWAGAYYDDVGMELIDSLWKKGYPADLIPTSEITNGSLYVDSDGTVCYGNQKYSAIVLYNPEFEKESTLAFLNNAVSGNTKLFQIGNWTYDFDGNSLGADSIMPSKIVQVEDTQKTLLKLIKILEQQNVFKHSPATTIIYDKYKYLADYNHKSYAPPTTGFSKLIDGTIIHVAGTYDVSGDPIKLDYTHEGKKIKTDAIGVVAFRFGNQNSLEAFVAGGLKYLESDNFKIELNERIDIALWKNSKNKWEGVIQSERPSIPDELKGITENWTLLRVPSPPPVN